MNVRVRCGSGLGDSIYLQSVCRHLADRGDDVVALSNWPDVFRPLRGRVRVEPFERRNCNLVAHYSMRRGRPTTQWQDCYLQAGIKDPVDLRLDWTVTDPGFVASIRAAAESRPLVIVQLPRRPMDRVDGFGMSLLPRRVPAQVTLNRLRELGCFLVQVGAGVPVYHLTGLDLDLANHTTVAQLLDLASIADGCFGYVSFLVPLAESLGKPALFIWSRRGLDDRVEMVRRITPRKIFHKPELCRAVFDDDRPAPLIEAADAFHRQITAARQV